MAAGTVFRAAILVKPYVPSNRTGERYDFTNNDWWRDAVIYQIYPRSFSDANGDGNGDLQ